MRSGIWCLDVTDARLTALKGFINDYRPTKSFVPLSGDASLRRYFRTENGIAVDAPPASQKNSEFLAVDRALLEAGVRAPRVIRADLARGFMLIEDLGDASLEAAARGAPARELYLKALDALLLLPRLRLPLPPFDQAFIASELGIFREWMLEKTLGLKLSASEERLLGHAFSVIAEGCLSQEQIPMHRDYHSRNLMVREGEIYVIDFQDMVTGPLAYDLISLIYDCYTVLPEALAEELSARAFEAYKARGFLKDKGFEAFRRDMDLTALQRHLKVLGIFRRLWLRDRKPGYLRDLPRVLSYAAGEACRAGLPELADFLRRNLPEEVICAP